MNILIVGTNFENKGAQSMLFTCFNEFNRRFPNSSISFTSIDRIDDSVKYKFKHIKGGIYAYNLALKKRVLLTTCYVVAKDLFKWVIGKEKKLGKDFGLRKEIKNIDLIVDASGFSLSSKWGTDLPRDYFWNFELAMKYDIPIVVMPQSFGPFEFGENQEKMEELIQRYFNYASFVFAREDEGKECLEKVLNKNIMTSADLVLVGEFPKEASDISEKGLYSNLPQLEEGNWVGIVPNTMLLSIIDEETLLKIYDSFIMKAASEGKNVCVFRHSEEDILLCKKITERNSDLVTYIDQDISCIDFGSFVSNFSYLLCSRYHAIVHAYRNGIPCILLGWATKYKSIAHLFEQDNLLLDLHPYLDGQVEEKMQDVSDNYVKYQESILNTLKKIRNNNNCFDSIAEHFKNR